MSDRSVHPAFDPSTQTWFTVEPGLRAEARSLEQLQRRLGEDVVITGYFPLGSTPAIIPARPAPSAPPPSFTTIVARKVQPARPTLPPVQARSPGRLTPPTKPSAAREARLAVKPPAPPARALPVTPPAARPPTPPAQARPPAALPPGGGKRLEAVDRREVAEGPAPPARTARTTPPPARASLPPPGMGSPEPSLAERLASLQRRNDQGTEDLRRRLEVAAAERRPHLARGPAPCDRCGEITDDEIAMVLETRGQVARKREYMQRYMKNLRRKRRAHGAIGS